MAQPGMAGKTVLLTGAAYGLGRATAMEFARAGASLALVDIHVGRLEETRALVRELGGDCIALLSDVGVRANCIEAVQAAVSQFGKLDVLCNCAAILAFDNLTEITADVWERTFAVNVHGPFYLSQAAIPHLLRSAGNILNVASTGAVRGTAYTTAYSASKAALVQMTKCMAMEYIDHPIRINAVAPGPMSTGIGENTAIPTDANPWLVQRLQGRRPRMDPAEVARVVVFVASDQASAIHGACVMADSAVSVG